ncbi:MAG TPA: amidase family protein [Longimicrobiales bacterium]
MAANPVSRTAIDRRRFMAYFSSAGLGGTLFPGVLWALGQGEVTKEMIAQAERIAGLEFTDAQREEMVRGLNRKLEAYEALRTVEVPNSVVPAIRFDPVVPGVRPPAEVKAGRRARRSEPGRVERPANLEEVAFWPVTKLAELVRTRQVTSVELTEMFLDRLERYGPTLECVVTLTTERALAQARRADEEIAAGRYRGPLHGIPWGAKDLLAVKGYPTTWGAEPYVDQVIDEDATVVRRLDEAGAVLVAKLTLGALAMGDVWFGGKTRNPWNLEQGSSGSSAGSAAATVAGLVGFSIGTETLGSIVSPSTRCGATGLRPTFGRVSRHGAMALSWTMDKIGPICRSVEDCALVFEAIHGPDGLDPTLREAPFVWDAALPLSELRIGYFASGFDEEGEDERDREWRRLDRQVLDVLRSLGAELIPFELPHDMPVNALRIILDAESAAAFDDLTRSGRDALMDERSRWPEIFREARFIPAVEYIQANRIRSLIMAAMDEAMRALDVFVTPSYAGSVLLTTNLTGHPTVVAPNGFTSDGTPVSISFIGNLWGEAEALAVAKAYQDATDHHLRVPPKFAV